MNQAVYLLLLVALVSPALGQYYDAHPGNLYKATQGDVWPKPVQMTKGNKHFVFDPHKLHFRAAGEKCQLITDTVMRYRTILQKQARGPLNEIGLYTSPWWNLGTNHLPVLNEVVIKLFGKCETYPHDNMDESYRLSVGVQRGAPIAMIQANAVWGVMRGLETFAQISFFNGTVHQLTVGEVSVVDYPRFLHRGLMIDTARHYLYESTIKLMLDAMEYNKLNVLHWHITDDQSFPYKSSKFPKLSENGAFRPYKIYTSQNIANIIDYARVRGIRVIPEFDTPGHTLSWGLGQPDLLTKCYSGSEPNGKFGPVDPSNDNNYEFLNTLFTEISYVFTDNHFHFGGDEVDFSCWKSNPDITKFMDQLKISGDYAKLESYYVHKVLEIAKDLKISPIVWQEVFQNDKTLSNDTIVHIWTGNTQSLLNEVTGSGRKAILSTCWYLDHFSQDLYAGGGDWTKFYSCEPLDFPGSDEMKKRVVGGEACMWGEFVDDTNIIQRVWPRACSAAERLWSSEFNVTAATHRLEEHVCRLRSRGVMAQPPNGPSTC